MDSLSVKVSAPASADEKFRRTLTTKTSKAGGSSKSHGTMARAFAWCEEGPGFDTREIQSICSNSIRELEVIEGALWCFLVE